MLEIPILLHLRDCHLLKHQVGFVVFFLFWYGGGVCVWLVGFLVCFLVGFSIYKLLLPYQMQVRVFKQAIVIPSKTPGR